MLAYEPSWLHISSSAHRTGTSPSISLSDASAARKHKPMPLVMDTKRKLPKVP